MLSSTDLLKSLEKYRAHLLSSYQEIDRSLEALDKVIKDLELEMKSAEDIEADADASMLEATKKIGW